MEIWHHLVFSKYDNVDSILDNLRIKYKKTPGFQDYYIITLEITESDSRWPQVARLIKPGEKINPSDILLEGATPDDINTVFSNGEILSAEYIRLQPVFEQCYPLPKEEYKENTFKNICPKCGVGYTQNRPLHIGKEPTMRKNDFMSPFWVYVLFCTKRIIKELESNAISGYEVWPVIIHSTNENSKVVSQLIISRIAGPALSDEDKFQPETCSQCGITTYLYHKRGYMHLKRESLIKDIDFQQTSEWFGSGRYGGFREIIISNRVAKLIIDNKWLGVSLKPTILI
jgi:hypothetical protein